MTAEEIKDSPAEAKTQMGWLKEIAYHLSLLSEAAQKNTDSIKFQPVPEVPKLKRK